MRVDIAFLVNQRLDEAAICEDDGGVTETFEREYGTVFAGPLREKEVTI